jgi:hypothetical protein
VLIYIDTVWSCVCRYSCLFFAKRRTFWFSGMKFKCANIWLQSVDGPTKTSHTRLIHFRLSSQSKAICALCLTHSNPRRHGHHVFLQRQNQSHSDFVSNSRRPYVHHTVAVASNYANVMLFRLSLKLNKFSSCLMENTVRYCLGKTVCVYLAIVLNT